MKKFTLALILACFGLSACDHPPPATGVEETHDAVAADAKQAAEGTQTATADDESKALNDMFAEYWEEYLKLNPVEATSIGDKRYNDQFPNFIGPDYIAQVKAFEQKYLTRIQEFDHDALQGQDRLSYDVFLRDRKEDLEGFQFPTELLPLNQFFSIPNFFAQMGSGQSIQPFGTVKDYEDWLSRVNGFTVWVDQAIANMRQGMSKGVVQPKVLMEKTLPQLEAHMVDKVEDSVFYGPVQHFPDGFAQEDKDRLTQAFTQVIQTQIIPGFKKLHDFIQQEYLPACRDSIAWSELPNGNAWYAYRVKTQTTTDMTPDEIHDFGVSEVNRILGEMRKVKDKVGFDGDLQAFFKHLQDSDEFYFKDKEALLNGYRELHDKINARLPKLFDVFPKADYQVREVPDFMAASSAGAFYEQASADGSRPGVFYVNTYNLRAQPKFGMVTLSLHEASPGHHFQISIQQEAEGLPAFRRFGGYTAYVEGWALYSESLGTQLGLYDDPYQWYGHLSDEQLRAMRLVVDTGMHAQGWTREQAIDYMKQNSSMAESDIVSEVERYIAIPGQALAYKIGQHVITDLREEARQALGDKFDIKAFHRQILIDGPLPLDVLQGKIREWIADQQAQEKKAA